jgi:hypothetical protein
MQQPRAPLAPLAVRYTDTSRLKGMVTQTLLCCEKRRKKARDLESLPATIAESTRLAPGSLPAGWRSWCVPLVCFVP